MRWLYLPGLLAVLGCSPPHLPAVSSYDVWLTPSTSPQTQKAVAEGVAQWVYFTDVVVRVHSGSQVCVLPGCFAVYEVSQTLLDKATDSDWIGWTNWGFIMIAGALNWDETQDTAIHELGHALGLIHHPYPSGRPPPYAVMNSTYHDGADHVACDDVAQFFAERGVVAPASLPACTDASGPLNLTGNAPVGAAGHP